MSSYFCAITREAGFARFHSYFSAKNNGEFHCLLFASSCLCARIRFHIFVFWYDLKLFSNLTVSYLIKLRIPQSDAPLKLNHKGTKKTLYFYFLPVNSQQSRFFVSYLIKLRIPQSNADSCFLYHHIFCFVVFIFICSGSGKGELLENPVKIGGIGKAAPVGGFTDCQRGGG